MSWNPIKSLSRLFLLVIAGLCVASLAGCAGAVVEQAASSPVLVGGSQAAPALEGLVHGGNLPVSAAVIQLWAVGTGGYGSAPTPLVSTANSYYPGGATGCSSTQTFSIQSFSIASNMVTFQGTSSVTPPVYSYVSISGLSSPAAATAGLNGQTLIVTSSSATQFTAALTTTASTGSTSDSGTATQVCSSNVITNYAGGFTLSPGGVLSYTCTQGTMLYLTATGGNPGLGEVATTSTSNNNAALAMMVPIGNCSKLTTNGTSNNGTITSITVNEVTTIVSAYALQNYIGITPGTTLSSTLSSSTPAFRIGAGAVGSNSYQGLTNAFELASSLVNIGTGAPASSYTPVTGGSSYSVESYQVNMLANALAGCVNNSTSSSPGCTTLFTYTTPPGTSNAPADTLEAAWQMAQNPTNNATNIANLGATQAAFNPFASSVNDLTVGASVTTPHPATPGYYVYRGFQVAVDGFGNLWVTSTGGVGGGTVTTNLVAEFDPAGQPLGVTHQYNTGSIASPSLSNISPSEPTSTTGSYQYPLGITIDPNNNAWVADLYDSQIIEIPASTGPGVASVGLTTTTSTGTPANNNLAYALTPGSFPSSIASDNAGNIYVALQGNSYGTSSPAGGVTANVAAAIVGLTASSIAKYNYNGTTAKGPLNSATLFNTSTDAGQVASTTATATPGTSDEIATSPTTSTAKGNAMLSLIFDYSSGYRGGPLVWVPEPQGCGAAGQILQLFGATDSSTTPTVTQGEATPLSPIANATQTTCKTSTTPALETSVANQTDNYNGTAFTTFGPEHPFSGAIDPNSSVWVLNQTKASSTSATPVYPSLSLTRMTPSYSVSSGVLSGSVTALTTVSGSLLNMVGSSYTDGSFAIDSAGNVWLGAGGAAAVVPETGNPGAYTTGAGFIEFNNAGTDISSQYYAGSPSTSTPTVPAIGSQFGYIGAYPLYSGSALVTASYRAPNARFGVAIDLGGTLWSAQATSNGSNLFMLLGGAAPTLAPISLGNPSKP
jgi:hypothetical protein